MRYHRSHVHSQEYLQYLQSPSWEVLRAKVLMRDKYLCQSCLTGRATQVHHLSYANLFNEFAWELTSVCEACHARLHPDEAPHVPAKNRLIAALERMERGLARRKAANQG